MQGAFLWAIYLRDVRIRVVCDVAIFLTRLGGGQARPGICDVKIAVPGGHRGRREPLVSVGKASRRSLDRERLCIGCKRSLCCQSKRCHRLCPFIAGKANGHKAIDACKRPSPCIVDNICVSL